MIRPKFFLFGDGIIPLEDNLAPLPWHLRVNLDVEDYYSTSAFMHPRQREGLRVLKSIYERHIIVSVLHKRDTRDVNIYPKTKVLVCRLKKLIGRLNM